MYRNRNIARCLALIMILILDNLAFAKDNAAGEKDGKSINYPELVHNLYTRVQPAPYWYTGAYAGIR